MKMSGLGWEYWYDSFNVFDTIVNLTSLAMFLLQAFSSSGSISSLSALRAVRILRVLKLMKRAESLQNFIAVLFATVSELGNFCAVVALVIIIFALLGMQVRLRSGWSISPVDYGCPLVYKSGWIRALSAGLAPTINTRGALGGLAERPAVLDAPR